MTQHAGIDTGALDELAATTDVAFVCELIEAYFEETPRYITLMREALSRDDAEDFRRAAHTIKSTSKTLGVSTIAEEAMALETMGRDGDLTGAAVKLDELAANYESVARLLQDWCHE